MPYDAVVFDYDGVLMEPTPLEVLRDAARRTFREHGVEPDPDEVRRLSIDVDHDWLQETAARYDIDPLDLWQARDTNASDHQIDLVERGQKHLYDDHTAIIDIDLPRGIVSTNQQRTLDHHLQYHDLAAHFHTVYGREPHPDSLWKKKPNPHYLERALADVGAETALFVGDSTSDVEAARNAGIDSAYIHREHNDAPGTTPTHEIASLHELLDLLSASPSADD